MISTPVRRAVLLCVSTLVLSCSLLLDEGGIVGESATVDAAPTDASSGDGASDVGPAPSSCQPGPKRFCDGFDITDWTPAGAGWPATTTCRGSITRETTRSVSAPGSLRVALPSDSTADSLCEIVTMLEQPWATLRVRARVFVEDATLSGEFTNILRAGYLDGTRSILVGLVLRSTSTRLEITGGPTGTATDGPVFPRGRWQAVVLTIDLGKNQATLGFGDAEPTVFVPYTFTPIGPSTNPATQRVVLRLGVSRFAAGLGATVHYDDVAFEVE